MGGMSWDGDPDKIIEEPNGKWYYTITLWPKTCCISGAFIPGMSKAYVMTGDFGEEHWATKEALMFAIIKGNNNV